MKKHLRLPVLLALCTLLALSTTFQFTSHSNKVYAEPLNNSEASLIDSEIISTTEQLEDSTENENDLETSTPTLNDEATPNSEAANGSFQVVNLTRNSKAYTFNGVNKELTQPVTEKNGTTYIPLKAIAELYGFNVSYDSKTRESTASSQSLSLTFKNNVGQVKINRSTVKTIPQPITISGSIMVPVRAWAELTETELTLTPTEIQLKWQVGPSAAFKVTNAPPIFANQTTVVYEDLASTPNGAKIVDEKWTGKQTIFTTPGKHTITRQVLDEFGIWSIPYTVTIDVMPENLPPVAKFSTNKDLYKLGEPITYVDLSTDDYKIKSVTWKNNEPVFFESGNKIISIVVEDIYGLKSEFNKAILISDEVMYSPEEYYYNFTKQGYKLPVEHMLALQAETIPYTISPDEASTVVRLNSPEQISKAGIDYTDTIGPGKIRFAYHKENKTPTSYQLYLVATNNNDYPVFISNDSFALGGPALYVNQSGKKSASEFLDNIARPKHSEVIEILPGQSIQLLPKEGLVEIRQGRTISIFADYSTSGPLQFTSLVATYGTKWTDQLKTLSQTEHDNTHIRGTFNKADRKLYFNHVFGSYPLERIVIGDRVNDSYITGVDAVSGKQIENAGNGAVKYSFTLDVKPNTIIMLNGRGGIYAGAFLVNNQVVNIPEDGYLGSSTEAAVLYRTKDARESINMTFIPAPGSNMPLSIIFDQAPVIEVEEHNKTKLNY